MITLTLLDGGHLRVAAGILRRGEDLATTVRLPVPVYLVETPRERILIDTGLHPDAVTDAVARYGRADALGPFGIEQTRTLAEQLDLGSLTRVVLTHLHFDHAGGLDLLPPTVPVVLQRREWAAGHDRAATARNAYRPEDYAAIADRVQLVDGHHDLLGDGSVELLPTPGHTPGHQSVRVGGRVIVGGDVAPFAAALDDGRFPVFGDDPHAQARSAAALRTRRDAGDVVLPGHDPCVLDVLRAGALRL